MIDLAARLEPSSIDFVSTNAGAVRARFQEVADFLPEKVSDAITPAVFVEFHRGVVFQARQRINHRLHREEILKTMVDSEAQLRISWEHLEALLLQPEHLHQTSERLRQELAELQAALAAEEEIAAVESMITGMPAEAERHARTQQEAEDRINRAREAIGQVADLGSNDEDLSFLVGLDNIRVNAVAAICRFL